MYYCSTWCPCWLCGAVSCCSSPVSLSSRPGSPASSTGAQHSASSITGTGTQATRPPWTNINKDTVDQQCNLFLILQLTNLSSEWKVWLFGIFKKFKQSITYFSIFQFFYYQMWLCLWSFFNKAKQTKANLQKYFHPSSLNHLIYAHVHCAMPRLRAKKGEQKVPIFLPLQELILYPSHRGGHTKENTKICPQNTYVKVMIKSISSL